MENKYTKFIYSVKSAEALPGGKEKVWSIIDKGSERVVGGFKGNKFTLQAVAKLLTDGKLSTKPTLQELIATAPPILLDGVQINTFPTVYDWLEYVTATVDELSDLAHSDSAYKEQLTESKAHLRIILASKNAIEANNSPATPRVLGYMRISTQLEGQKFDRQEDQLKAYGCDVIYSERVSGSIRDRKQLNNMIEDANAGDTIIILSIDRLSRSTKDLLDIVEAIRAKGAVLKSINDSWLDTSSENPMSEFLLTVMGALGQMEREMIRKRVLEGMAVAKAKGQSLGRPKANKTKVSHALELYATGKYTTKEICTLSGISKATLYRKIKETEEAVKND